MQRLTSRLAVCGLVLATLILFNNLSRGAAVDTPTTKDAPTMPTLIQDAASSGRFVALRLRPGMDLRDALEAAIKRHNLRAAAVVTCVGSLNHANLRLANAEQAQVFPGKLEIVSLTGTLSPDGVHLHISVSDNTGRTFGGHLLHGSPIYTTAEIVLVELPEIAFTRETDAETSYRELVIRKRD
jgi:predicted DNA-binding protein with PD1-like motif